MKIYYHNIIERTKVEGPGVRTAIWFQGCSIRCEDCMIPDTWHFTKERSILVDDFVNLVVNDKAIEGITILGGEPFDQSEALMALIKSVKKQSDLSIMLFSGYTKDSLEAKKSIDITSILSLVDIFIEGPYVKEYTDFSRQWVGSSNQKIHFLSNRYQGFDINRQSKNYDVEVRISKDGYISINGMLPKNKFHDMIDQVKHSLGVNNEK